MKKFKLFLFTTTFISLGVVISVKASDHHDDNANYPTSTQAIPSENVSIVHNDDGSLYVLVHEEDAYTIYSEADHLPEDERLNIITDANEHYNPSLGFTNQEFEQAIEIIEHEMSETGYIKDKLHVENGFRGFLRDMVTENFINDGDTIRTHYDKVDQLINYMNKNYKRTEKVTSGQSTVSYTEHGKADLLIQTITEQSDTMYQQLNKAINELKDTKRP